MSPVAEIPSLSVSRRLGQAIAEVGAGLAPIAFLLYALLASGCTGPAAVPQMAPNLKGVVAQKMSGTPRSAGNGQGTFSAMVVLENQVLPSLSTTTAAYDVSLDGAAHSVPGGQAIGAQTTDDTGGAWWVLMLAQNFAAPTESVMVALPASLYTAGSVQIDGYQAVAYLVDANGNPLAYSTSGTLTLTAAPTAPGGLVTGSFDGTFALVPTSAACRLDTDCAAGEVCASGTCMPADCTVTGCPAGMTCDAYSGACVPAGCATDADCGSGLACRNGQCIPAGCSLTGCPAGTVCDASSGQCLAQPTVCRTDAECAAGQVCVGGQCQVAPSGCQTTGCPAGYACDYTTGACVASPAVCRTDADCARGMVCEYGQCSYPSGCQSTGCPAGYSCDYNTGSCVGGGTGTGNCFPQPRMGNGSFTGSAGEVPMCSAAGLGSLNGGPDAGLFDGADENYNPATLFVLGDLMSGNGDSYFIAVLDQCPAAGTVLSAPATRFLVLSQKTTSDTVIQVQKTASAGTLSFSAGANGALTATLSATFGTDTVTGEGSVQ
ncbi:MAG TPA: hypothetical protein VGK67_08255 [Myxococcales bacterium]